MEKKRMIHRITVYYDSPVHKYDLVDERAVDNVDVRILKLRFFWFR